MQIGYSHSYLFFQFPAVDLLISVFSFLLKYTAALVASFSVVYFPMLVFFFRTESRKCFFFHFHFSLTALLNASSSLDSFFENNAVALV